MSTFHVHLILHVQGLSYATLRTPARPLHTHQAHHFAPTMPQFRPFYPIQMPTIRISYLKQPISAPHPVTPAGYSRKKCKMQTLVPTHRYSYSYNGKTETNETQTTRKRDIARVPGPRPSVFARRSTRRVFGIQNHVQKGRRLAPRSGRAFDYYVILSAADLVRS